jgi:predicted nucleic acid-binding protein
MKGSLDMNSIFLDTNFFLDIFDTKRERHTKAKEVLELFLANGVELYTSSDIISTISYFLQKKLDLKISVTNIDFIVQQVVVLMADNADFIKLNQIILEELEINSELNIDYEDCMQLFLANKHQVQNILTSDKSFCKGIAGYYFVNIVSLEDCLSD